MTLATETETTKTKFLKQTITYPTAQFNYNRLRQVHWTR